jgi:hypothetical protein
VRAEGMVQTVQHLPRRCEALSSNPTITKKQINKKIKVKNPKGK